MQRIFFAPVADVSKNGKFFETAISGITTANGIKQLWGVISPDITWNRISKGDFLFIYNKGYLVYYATIKAKFEDTNLSKSLWSPKYKIDGTILYYDKILEFDKIYSCNISFDVFKDLAGYKEKASVRKFMELSEIGYSNLTKKYDTIEKIIKITAPNNGYKT
ncbi:MAG: hypothetical protein R3D00_07980 [Bacteroidia bacterium]